MEHAMTFNNPNGNEGMGCGRRSVTARRREERWMDADGSWHRAVDVFNPDGPPARPVRKEEA
jgi:hypothetical protein